MTDIERLKATKDFLREEYQENLKKCKHPELKPLIKKTYHENKKAFEVAISAFEKQIPKKVVPYDCGQFRCECGEIVKSYEKYCPECGQALDWSDT